MSDLTTISLPAHAKLNLALAVGPPLPDGPKRGYHPIASWFVAIDLHDDVRLTRSPTGHPSTYHIAWASDALRPSAIDWAIEKDLGVRAHRLLESHVGRALPVEMCVHKRVPVGGGLGGGSSDAAAVLLGLCRLFDLAIPAATLHQLAGTLGSDVAFFLDDDANAGSRPPRPAIVTGLGERIERLPARTPAQALLIFPPFGCPTGQVYHAFDRALPGPLCERGVRELASATCIEPRALFNDLADPACSVEPRLGEMRSRLRKRGVHASVTGSGSTMFVIPAAGQHMSTIAAVVRETLPEAAAAVCSLV